MPRKIVEKRATFTCEDGDPARTLTASSRLLNLRKVHVKSAADVPLYYIRCPQDDITNKGNYDKGHLIAESFGGPNISANIVPITSHSNKRGPWKDVEEIVGAKLRDGEISYMGVLVEYNGTSPIPASFIVRCSRTDLGPPSLADIAGPGETQPKFDATVISYTWRISHSLLPRAPLDQTAEVQKYLGWFEQYKEDFQNEVPTPAHIYEFLDWIYAKRNISKIQPAGFSTRFNQHQKQLILAYNGYKNQGTQSQLWITSDDSEDIYRELNVQGCGDSPHIDHILPFSRGGNNAFTNARVVSEKHNATKSAKLLSNIKRPEPRRSARNAKAAGVGEKLRVELKPWR